MYIYILYYTKKELYYCYTINKYYYQNEKQNVKIFIFARSNNIILLFIHICDVIKIKFLVHEKTNIYIFNEKYINL